MARPCPPRAVRTRISAATPSSAATRSISGFRNASWPWSSAKRSTTSGLLIEHPPQEQALEEPVLGACGQGSGDLVILKQRPRHFKRPHLRLVTLLADVEEAHVIRPGAGVL